MYKVTTYFRLHFKKRTDNPFYIEVLLSCRLIQNFENQNQKFSSRSLFFWLAPTFTSVNKGSAITFTFDRFFITFRQDFVVQPCQNEILPKYRNVLLQTRVGLRGSEYESEYQISNQNIAKQTESKLIVSEINLWRKEIATHE